MQKPKRYVLVLALAGLTAYGVRAQTLTSVDVNSTLVGSTTESDDNGTKVWTIVAGGADIWGTADGMRYAYMEATGTSWDYVVKVRDLQGPDAWSKAELMARESYSGSSLFIGGGDRHLSQMTTRSAGQNQVAMQWRHTFTGASQWASDVGLPFVVQRPTYPDTWLRLRREGPVFLAFASSDGVNWESSNDPLDTSDLTSGFWNGPDAITANVMAIGLAVTAHNDADAAGATAVFSDFGEHVAVPVAIETQPPATVDLPANNTLQLSATATGDICKTEWRKNGVAIPGTQLIGGGTLVNTYVIDLAQISDSGSYTLYAEGDLNNVTSDAAVVTVTADTTPPTMTRAIGGSSRTEVTISFSEPVKAPTATTAANYTIAGLSVTGAALSADEREVLLTTAQQAENTLYTITVNNVEDGAGNPIAPGSTIVFNSAKFVAGLVMWQRWDGPGSLDEFIAAYDAGTLGAPLATWNTTLFESGRDLGDNYWGHGSTLLKPATSGDYRFIVCADDNARVFLSTDADPANKLVICAEASWSNNREWTSATDEQDSELSAVATWPTFEISLVAGQTYFLEGFWDEGGGGDGLELTWTTYVGDGTGRPANGTVSALSGDLVGTYADPTILPPVPPVITEPAANYPLTANPGDTITLSVVTAAQPYEQTYQWQWNGVDIAGATSADYVITDAIATDSGQYWCVVVNANENGTASATSPPVHVMVTATGVYSIEAEDFDYDNGQTVAAASVMPYLGGAYDGLSATHGVDYNSGNGSADSPLYRTGAVIAQGTASPMGNEQGGNQFAITRMGEWETTANFKVGWVDSGDWGNYTRTFPTPAQTYWVFAGAGRDGLGANGVDGNLGIVTAGVGTVDQTVQKLGNFTAPGTGAWSRNSLVALTDDAGAIATVEIGGLNTIRWNYNGGDADYLVFVPASAVEEGPVITEVIRTGNSITVTWTGGGEAEVTDDLNGTWQATGDTDGSYTGTIQPGNAFLRIKK